MAVESLSARIAGQIELAQTQRAMEKPSWACAVNYESCAKLHRIAIPLSCEHDPVAVISDPIKLNLIDKTDPKFLSLLDQEVVEVSSIPMRIRNLVTRAGGHEQLVMAFRIRRGRSAEHMVMKGKSALETAGNMWIGSLPTAPFCERPQRSQAIARGQIFQEEIGKRC
jgi:hypothetical protein